MKMPKYFYFRIKTGRKGVSVELEDASDVDVEEIVRCGKCEYMNENDQCTKFAADNIYLSEEDYCSYGREKS